MNSYTMHQVGMARQHERLASADRARLAKAPRPAARAAVTAHTTDVHTHRPLSWLRETVETFSHIAFRTGAHQGSR